MGGACLAILLPPSSHSSTKDDGGNTHRHKKGSSQQRALAGGRIAVADLPDDFSFVVAQKRPSSLATFTPAGRDSEQSREHKLQNDKATRIACHSSWDDEKDSRRSLKRLNWCCCCKRNYSRRLPTTLVQCKFQ